MAKLYLTEEEDWVNLYENDEESLAKTEKEIRAKVQVSSMFDELYGSVKIGFTVGTDAIAGLKRITESSSACSEGSLMRSYSCRSHWPNKSTTA